METARNLGVTIDQQPTFDVHARACSTACFYHLRRNVTNQRQFVDNRSLRLLVHALSRRRLRNNLYCVEWDVKLYYTIPLSRRV